MKNEKDMPLFNQVAKANAEITMSSREIADLTEKRHPDVKRDIDRMLSELQEDARKFAHIYLDSMNRQQTEYLLNRELTETLLLGYSAPLRLKVIRRLRELEEMVKNPPIDLNDPASLRMLLLGYTEKVTELEAKVEEARPKVEALDRLSSLSGAMCITDAAKNLSVAPNKLFRWMDTNGWTYRRQGSLERSAYQSKVTAGYLELRPIERHSNTTGNDFVITQVRVTAKGLTYLAQIFPPAAKLV